MFDFPIRKHKKSLKITGFLVSRTPYSILVFHRPALFYSQTSGGARAGAAAEQRGRARGGRARAGLGRPKVQDTSRFPRLVLGWVEADFRVQVRIF